MTDNSTPYNASSYEKGIKKTVPFYDSFYNETIALIQYLKPDVKFWLDTGCGTGSLVTRAYHIFPKTTFILADPSSEMLLKAHEALKEIPKKNLF